MFLRDALRASRACGAAVKTPRVIGPATWPCPSVAQHQKFAACATAAAAADPAVMLSPAQADEAVSTRAAIHARFQGRTCLVQGASRGLGLEFVRQLLEVPGTTVVATCRDPAAAKELQALVPPGHDIAAADAAGSRLHLVRLDVCDEGSIQRAAEDVSALVPSLDLLINCSAVLHGPNGMAPETSYSRIRGDHMALAFATNAIGPMLVCRSLLPLLLRSPGASPQQPSLVANLSARVSSLGDNRLGGWYSYRASKAALNQMGITLALELRRKRAPAAVVMLHPGTCDTDLSRPFHKNVPPGKLFDRPRGARQLLGILARLSAEDSGRFIAWDGQDVPW